MYETTIHYSVYDGGNLRYSLQTDNVERYLPMALSMLGKQGYDLKELQGQLKAIVEEQDKEQAAAQLAQKLQEKAASAGSWACRFTLAYAKKDAPEDIKVVEGVEFIEDGGIALDRMPGECVAHRFASEEALKEFFARHGYTIAIDYTDDKAKDDE